MLIKFETLKERLHGVILNKGEQGYDVSGLEEKLDNLPESFDSIMSFVDDINSIRIRDDWEYVEPNSIKEIKFNSDPNRIKSKICDIDLNDSSKRVEAAFLSSLCGCILGKPLEASLTGSPCIEKELWEVCVLVIPFVLFPFGSVLARQNSISQSAATDVHTLGVIIASMFVLL